MAVEVILPRVDMDMQAGKITQWFVDEGESVAKGKPLFEIETDKAAMEIEAPASGVLRGVAARPGDELPVGAVIGWIYGVDEAWTAAKPAAPAQRAVEAASVAPAIAAAPPARIAADGLRATPKARRLARESGVDIADIRGSGPHGRVQASDVASAVPKSSAGALLNREWLAPGEGAPIVLVHGFGSDLSGWRPLVRHFAPGRPALALDLPGHGRSKPIESPDLEALVDALETMLADEGVSAAHLVGHSLGAAVSVAFAARNPKAARSLTLLAPGGLGPDFNGAFLDGFLRAQTEASLAPWLRLLASDEAALGGAMAKTTLRQRRETGVGAAQERLAAALFPYGVQAFDVREKLARIAGPAKIIFGLDDRIIPAHHAHGLPGAIAIHLFANVGHMPHLEARDAVALLIQDNVAAGERRIAFKA
jgi:pimeloyl-ACP methyl ester carboxylesterase